MKEIISNPWLASLVVLISQIIFLYLRTLNVIYTAEKKVLASIITGNGISLAWLISITIGISAITELQWQPILAYIVGGTIGIWFGFKTDKIYKK